MKYGKIALALAAMLCSTSGSAAIYTQVTLSGSAPYVECSISTPLQCQNLISFASATFNFGPDETSMLQSNAAALLTSDFFVGGNTSAFPGPDGTFRFSVNFLSPLNLALPGQHLGLNSVTGGVSIVRYCGKANYCTDVGSLTSFSLKTSETAFGATGLTSSVDVGFGAAAPEPAAWVMMVSGFGAVGLAMRRRQRLQVRFA